MKQGFSRIYIFRLEGQDMAIFDDSTKCVDYFHKLNADPKFHHIHTELNYYTTTYYFHHDSFGKYHEMKF